MTKNESSPKSRKKRRHKSRVGVLWWAPILLFGMTLLVFSFACLPYANLLVSAASVYLVDTDKVVQTKQAAPGEYPVFGTEFAILRIDSAGVFYPVYQGDTLDSLSKGVCHFYGSAMPGEGTNVVFTAHRTTHFAELGNMQPGDQAVVSTGWGDYIYEMVDSEIIAPGNEVYLKKTSEEQLTLLTCYRFDFMGSAPERYVVRCRLVSGVPYKWWGD